MNSGSYIRVLSAPILFLLLLAIPFSVSSKRVKQTLKIETTKLKDKNKKEKVSEDSESKSAKTLIKIQADSVRQFKTDDSLASFNPQNITFAGYDKQVSSRRESFHIVNSSSFTLRKALLKINYLDMQGRMLHSRTATVNCYIPAGETRKVDIPTWDTQFTFYYYLSNEPRRVATPYKVELRPIAFWIEP
ncbi:MAG: hypothetical protein K2J82_06835 [Muribaculaceae bacterium]|nr:hypothetical protein [Muribaculaceae bacterium]MDE6754309.1 hypothetical protein [Muribaculaceae bacterium]